MAGLDQHGYPFLGGAFFREAHPWRISKLGSCFRHAFVNPSAPLDLQFPCIHFCALHASVPCCRRDSCFSSFICSWHCRNRWPLLSLHLLDSSGRCSSDFASIHPQCRRLSTRILFTSIVYRCDLATILFRFVHRSNSSMALPGHSPPPFNGPGSPPRSLNGMLSLPLLVFATFLASTAVLICDSTKLADTMSQVIPNTLLPSRCTAHNPDRCYRRRHSTIRGTRRSHRCLLFQHHSATMPINHHRRRDLVVACLYHQCLVQNPRNIHKSLSTIKGPHREACRNHLPQHRSPRWVPSCLHLPTLQNLPSQSIHTNHERPLQTGWVTMRKIGIDPPLAP